PSAVVAAGGLAALGGVAFALSARQRRASVAVLAVAGTVVAIGSLALAGVQAARGQPFRIAQTTKFLREDRVVFERWNAFSRVTVSTAPTDEYFWLHIDADAATRMYASA